jgi:ABC-type microcin C transport system permease subunit YejB
MTKQTLQQEQETVSGVIVDNPKAIVKSYSSVSLIANFMIAISGVGFAALGALTYLDITMIFILMAIFTALGFIGRFIKEDLTGAPTVGPVGFKGFIIRVFNLMKNKFSSSGKV